MSHPTYHDPTVYAYQADLIRAGKCYNCRGEKKVHIDEYNKSGNICPKCEGSGKPEQKDYERLGIYDKGICVICKLPHIEGYEKNPSSKYEPSGVNDCLDHLRQHMMRLEKRVKELEA